MKILDEKLINEYYQALVQKDLNYEGLFYACIKTTKIFCHCTCPARKPKAENVEFYTTVAECIKNGYQACKRCHPLDDPNKASYLISYLLKEVNKNPDRKWDETDLKGLDIHPNTARRHFKNHYGITFKQYVRQMRINNGLEESQNVISQQVASGYESNSGFNYALKKLIERRPKDAQDVKLLALDYIDTPIGTMLSVSDDNHLFLLAFKNSKDLDKRIAKHLHDNEYLIFKESIISKQIKAEIISYFKGELKIFKTPYEIRCSSFVLNVLNNVSKVTYGQKATYSEIATISKTSPRAAGRANSLNPLAIIVPCHRLIGTDNSLKNYYGGISKKKYLLDFEAQLEKKKT